MRIPSLTIDILVAVIALVERRSFESAGEELSLSASAVHKRVRTAENLLGRRLFLGTDDGMTLTREGEIFYPDAIRAIELALLAEEKTKALIDLNAGRLIVGHSTYLPPRLLAFVMRDDTALVPAVRVERVPGLTASLAKRVVDGTLHAAFGELSVSHPDLLSRQLMEEDLMVCMPRSHPLALKPTIRPQDLNDVPVVAVSREESPRQHEEIEEYFAGFGVRLSVAGDAFGPPDALSMVEQNFGLCFVGASSARSSPIVARPLSIKTLTRKSGIYVREDNRHPALNEFVNGVLRDMGQRGGNRWPSNLGGRGRSARSRRGRGFRDPTP